jgi:transcriptional regulator with XRE-family HTH domain
MMKNKILIQLREEKDWTLTETAQLLRISQNAYLHYEDGSKKIPPNVLQALCELYNVDPEYILGTSPVRKNKQKI